MVLEPRFLCMRENNLREFVGVRNNLTRVRGYEKKRDHTRVCGCEKRKRDPVRVYGREKEKDPTRVCGCKEKSLVRFRG